MDRYPGAARLILAISWEEGLQILVTLKGSLSNIKDWETAGNGD